MAPLDPVVVFLAGVVEVVVVVVSLVTPCVVEDSMPASCWRVESALVERLAEGDSETDRNTHTCDVTYIITNSVMHSVRALASVCVCGGGG